MALDLTRALPEGSHAWCSDCPWTDRTVWCHTQGQTHTALFGHIVHAYEAEPVDNPVENR